MESQISDCTNMFNRCLDVMIFFAQNSPNAAIFNKKGHVKGDDDDSEFSHEFFVTIIGPQQTLST